MKNILRKIKCFFRGHKMIFIRNAPERQLLADFLYGSTPKIYKCERCERYFLEHKKFE